MEQEQKSNEESLEKIKAAENRAARLIESANEEKARIIAETRQKAIDVLEAAEARAQREREQLLEKQRKETEDEKQKDTMAMESRIKKLKADSRNKIAKEVEYMYQKFLEAIG